MNGKIIGLEKSFFGEGDKLTVEGRTLDFDYEPIEEPPLHTNCRCTTVPIIVGERQIISNLIKKEAEKAKKKVDKELDKLKKEKMDLQIELELAQKKNKKEIEKKIKDISSKIDKIINEK